MRVLYLAWLLLQSHYKPKLAEFLEYYTKKCTFVNHLLYTAQVLVTFVQYARDLDIIGNIFLAPAQMVYVPPYEQTIIP